MSDPGPPAPLPGPSDAAGAVLERLQALLEGDPPRAQDARTAWLEACAGAWSPLDRAWLLERGVAVVRAWTKAAVLGGGVAADYRVLAESEALADAARAWAAVDGETARHRALGLLLDAAALLDEAGLFGSAADHYAEARALVPGVAGRGVVALQVAALLQADDVADRDAVVGAIVAEEFALDAGDGARDGTDPARRWNAVLGDLRRGSATVPLLRLCDALVPQPGVDPALLLAEATEAVRAVRRDDGVLHHAVRLLNRPSVQQAGLAAAELALAIGLLADRMDQHRLAGQVFAWGLRRLPPEGAETATALRLELEGAENQRLLGDLPSAIARLRALLPRVEGRGDDIELGVRRYLAEALTEAGEAAGLREALAVLAPGTQVAQRLDHPLHPKLCMARGRVHVMLGESAAARASFEEGVGLFRQRALRGEPVERSLAASEFQLAMILDGEERRDLARQSLARLEALPGASAREVQRGRRALALAESVVDQHDAAVDLAWQALNGELQLLRPWAAAADWQELAVVDRGAREALAVLLLVCSRHPDPAVHAGRCLRGHAVLRGLRARVFARRRAEFERRHGAVRRAFLERVAAGEILDAAARIQALPLAADKVADLLTPPDLDRILDSVPADAALVQYVCARPPADVRGPVRSWLALVCWQGAVHHVALAPDRDLVEALGALRDGLPTRADGRDSFDALDLDPDAAPADPDLDALLRRLRRLAWDPVAAVFAAAPAPAAGPAEVPAGPRQLFLAPDGALGLVPFGALPLDDGRRLGEAMPLTCIDGAGDLERLGFKEPSPPGPPLVLGAPDFDLLPVDGGPPRVSGPLRPLPGAADEARAVAAALAVPPQLGPEARLGSLRVAEGPEILHLASHGLVEVALQPAQPPRTGVALAGVHDALQGRSLPLDAGTGWLSAQEVLTLDLHGTDLVVLSACHLGAGPVEELEGVAGLVQAFRQAGARSVLAALWSVEDGLTALWMQAFYTALLAGRGRAEAVGVAAAAARQAGAPLSTWAAFVLWGDPGPLLRSRDLPTRSVETRSGPGFVVQTIDVGGKPLRWAQVMGEHAPARQWLVQGRAATDAGDAAEGRRLARMVLDEPAAVRHHPDAWRDLGFSWLAEHQGDKALGCFMAAWPGTRDDADRAHLHYGRGTARMLQGDMVGARGDFDRALAHDGGQRWEAVMRINRAHALAMQGLAEAARQDARVVLARGPDDQQDKARQLLAALEEE